MKRAICLSGGASRGSYEMGVWKALRKLNIKYDIVTGASIGAINGSLMVTNAYKTAMKFWKKADYKTVFDKNFIPEKDELVLKEYTKRLMKGEPLKLTGVELILKKVLDLKKFYESNIDFGLMTVEFPSFKPKALTKKSIKEKQLIDFLIASSTVSPLFEKKKIDSSFFIDGGFYDNMPINLAIKMGAEEIIAVDLKAVGFNQKVKNKKVSITTIKPNNNLGNTFLFKKSQVIKNICYGYNDTLKIFNILEGKKYTFYKNSLETNYKMNKTRLVDFYYEYLKEKATLSKCNKSLEYLSELLNIDDTKTYYPQILNIKIKVKVNKLLKNNVKLKINDLNKKDVLLYFIKNINNKRKISKYSVIFKKELEAAIYYKSIL